MLFGIAYCGCSHAPPQPSCRGRYSSQAEPYISRLRKKTERQFKIIRRHFLQIQQGYSTSTKHLGLCWHLRVYVCQPCASEGRAEYVSHGRKHVSISTPFGRLFKTGWQANHVQAHRYHLRLPPATHRMCSYVDPHLNHFQRGFSPVVAGHARYLAVDNSRGLRCDAWRALHYWHRCHLVEKHP